MAELTDRFVFVNSSADIAISTTHIKIDLGPNADRVPYSSVELISATLLSSVLEMDAYVIKTDDQAMNYFSSDLTGTSVGVLAFNGVVDALNTYTLQGFAPQLVFGGNTRYLTLYIESPAGVKQTLDTFGSFTMSFKCKYPKVGSMQEAYRQQIPL